MRNKSRCGSLWAEALGFMVLQGSESFCHKTGKTGSLFSPQKPLLLPKTQQLQEFFRIDSVAEGQYPNLEGHAPSSRAHNQVRETPRCCLRGSPIPENG